MPQLPPANIRRDAASGLTIVTALTLVLHAVGAGGPVHGLLAIITFTFAPGAALLTVLPPARLPVRIGLAAAFSMTIVAAFSYALLLLHAFHPAIIIWSLYPVSCVVLLWRAGAAPEGTLRERVAARLRRGRERLKRDHLALSCLIVTAVAIVVWASATFPVEIDELGGLGLITALPIAWKAGWGVALLAAVVYATSQRPAWWILTALVAAPIAMFYLTPVIIYEIPHLPWAYKHIGVTELLLDLHHTQPDLDIYNRWPSFFGAAGVFTRLGSFENPVQYIGWAEIYFISIQTTLVAALALANDRRVRVAGLVALLFFVINWVAQAYFAPQAMGFTLMLAVLVILWQFLSAGGNRLGHLLERIGGMIVRRKQRWEGEPYGEWPRAVAAVAVLLPTLGVVLVHQLTPIVLVLQIGAMWMFGFLRPRWVFWAAAAITLIYLLPQLGWVDRNFGLFSSLNPLDNAKNVQTETFICDADCKIVKGSARLFTILAWLAAFTSILILGRRRPDARTGALALCFMTPFITLFGQNYGGEAALRVVLFGAPFTALLIALAISTFGPRLRRATALLAVLVLGSGLVLANHGLEGAEYLMPDDMATSEYVVKNIPKGSVLVAGGVQNVSHQSANYNDFYDLDTVAMILSPKFQQAGYSDAVVPYLVSRLEGWEVPVFVGFSPRNNRFNAMSGLLPEGFMEQLQDDVRRSPDFRIWKRVGDNEIYIVVATEKR